MPLSKNKADINKFSGPRINNNKPATIKNNEPNLTPWKTNFFEEQKKQFETENMDFSAVNKSTTAESSEESSIAKNNHATNEFSDCDNIKTNEVEKIMVDLKNSLGEEKYNLYIKYMKGKKLKDLVYKKDVKDKNGKVIHKAGTLKTLDDSAKDLMSGTDIQEINNIITKSGKNSKKGILISSSDGKIELSDAMMNSTIHDVKNTESGYDAMILVTEKGQPILVNSSTNPESPEDIAAILLSISNQVMGQKGAKELMDQLYDSLLGDDIMAGKDTKDKTWSKVKEILGSNGKGKVDAKKIKEAIYNGQIKDNQEAIKECMEIAKKNGTKTVLSGYSLGGGIQLAAYESLVKKDKKIKDEIESVAVYNPYIGFAEQYKNINGEDLIDSIGKDKKVTIYSAEQDYISTFNDSLSKLKKRLVFVNAKSLDEASDSINILQDFIVGRSGNHGFSHIKMDSFDEDGNISKEGTFIPIDVSFGTLTDDDDEEKNKIQKREYEIKDEDFEQNYKNIVKALFHFKEKSGDGKDQDFMGTVLSGFIKKIEDYIVNNIGNYDYDELVDVAVDGAWDILEDSEDEIAKRAADFVEEKISGLAKVDTPLDWVDDALNGAIEGLGAAGSWLAENGVDGLLSQLENNLLDENGIKASLKDFLKDDENKEAFINLIYSSITGDKTGYEGAADILK